MNNNDDQRIVKIYKYSEKFHDQLDLWMIEDGVKPNIDNFIGDENYQAFSAAFKLAQINTIKKHISSTHIWIIGKTRYIKKRDNWFTMPIECKICKMGASSFHEFGWIGEDIIEVNLENGDMPSKDMHGHLISRTCSEVLEAKSAHRKLHKGGKCIQCNTYDCLFKGI